MKPHPFRVDLIRQLSRGLKPQTSLLRPACDPGERQIRHEMIVFVETSYIAVVAGEDQFLAFAFAIKARQEADDVEIPAALVARDRVACGTDVIRTIRRDVEAHRRIDRVPESEALDGNILPVEPFGEIAREQRSAREAEEEDFRIGEIRTGLLEPAAGRLQNRTAIGTEKLAEEIGAEVGARSGLQMQALVVVINAKLPQARHIGEFSGHALSCPFEKQNDVHCVRSLLRLFTAEAV